jgi:hypothetical protein
MESIVSSGDPDLIELGVCQPQGCGKLDDKGVMSLKDGGIRPLNQSL